MRFYLDTSAYLCVLLNEEGADQLISEIGGAEILSSVLLVLEANRNLIRLARMGEITAPDLMHCLQRIEQDRDMLQLRGALFVSLGGFECEDKTMNAFLKFMTGLLRTPAPWKPWLAALIGANAIAPLFFWDHVESRVVLATILASSILMTLLTARFGFTRILGLGHILWIPMLIFLLSRLDSIPANDGFGIWIRVLLVINAVSIVIDAVDVYRYLGGDREETVEGL